ncbi:MAG: hypothetical protein MUO21_03015 [Nitrososphaeraceae archaeon]|nr:hypothetical protein [Nitrososphaeraceae archaeon]
MTKIVVNRKHGGFGLSIKAQIRYLDLIGKKCYFYERTKWAHENNGVEEYTKISPKKAEDSFIAYSVTEDLGKKIEKLPNDERLWYDGNLERTDPILIQVINEMGEKADDRFAKLEIVEIPDGVEWQIDEYDGYESIHETHRSW